MSALYNMLAVLLAASTGYVAYTFFGAQVGLVAGISLLFVLIILVALLIARPISLPTEYLARAILHVSSEQADMPAPQASMLPASREFMERLTSYVYDIASKNPIVTTSSQPITSAKDTSPVPYITADHELVITSVSQSALQFIELSDDVVGKKLYDVFRFIFPSNDTLDSWLEFTNEKSVAATRAWQRVRIQTAKDTLKQVDMAARYSKDDPNGNDLTVVLFDQTEKYSQDDSGASFVSMAVHELRTPLTVMRGYIEVFEDELADKLNPEQAEFLRNLSAQAQQLGSFVSNVQNLARIESNSLELQLKSDTWTDILNSALNDMDLRAKVRHKTIERNIANDLPMAGVDRTTIYEVIINIVENAIKYTHTEAPIKVTAKLKDQNWIETTVEDHGIGIPSSLIEHIFDKFYRSHRSNKAVGGTGLGLYICKTIIEAHGGEIWVKTKEGEGTTFGFTIPTYDSIAHEVRSSDNAIERSAHGWIKNHTLYRR